MKSIAIIAAIGKDRGLGFEGRLLWSIPDDLRHFKEITSGHPVIMGRKTWESIPLKYRPLPGRANIVITRQADYEARGATVMESLEAALTATTRALGADAVFIIGGGGLYAEALPVVDRLYLTLVDATAEADIFFPAYEKEFTKVISEKSGTGDPPHRFVTLERA
ncbi:MAG: dihydrofolate reductase [Candidatus Paceibacterota bacterium]